MTALKRFTAITAGIGAAALFGLAFAGPAGAAAAAPTPYPSDTATSTPTSTPTDGGGGGGGGGGGTGPVTADPGTPAAGASITAGGPVTLGGGGASANGSVGAGISSNAGTSGFVKQISAVRPLHGGATLLASVGLGSTMADASGHYSVTVTIPSDIPNGPATLFTTDAKTGKTLLSIPVKITGSTYHQGGGGASASATNGAGGGNASGGGGGTAATGVAVVGIGVLGLALLVGGFVLLAAGRKRKAVHTA